MTDDIPRLFGRIEREIAHLQAVRARLLEGDPAITPEWVAAHASDELFIDRLNSFGIQLGRTAESVTKKLLPQLLEYAGETVGSVIDNLNTAHKVGWIDDPTAWTELNRVRNTLVHEYLLGSMTKPHRPDPFGPMRLARFALPRRALPRLGRSCCRGSAAAA